MNINVGEDTSVAIGGVSYETSQGAVVYFDDRDFNDYCQERMDDYQTINHLTFDALPSASQGVLYYDYRSASNTGAQVTTGTPTTTAPAAPASTAWPLSRRRTLWAR